MEKVFEDINNALCKFERYESYNEGYFSFMYPFTTENINGYLSKFDVKDKDILTVTASGDHVLNLLLEGCKNIDTFDINPLTKYYMNLKIAGVKALDYEEFFEYFCYVDYPKTFKYNKEAFNIKSYWKISNYLDKYTKIFWDNLYLELNGLDIRKNDLLICMDEEKHRVLRHTNNYLNKDNFYKLKNILKNNNYNISFYNINMLDIHKLNKKYDLILLSNISQYIQKIYNSEDINYCMNEYKKTIQNISNNLNDNGQILIGYFYDIDNSHDNYCTSGGISYIYNFPVLNKIFDNKIEYLFFNGVEDYKYVKPLGYIKDSVGVYKKVKK